MSPPRCPPRHGAHRRLAYVHHKDDNCYTNAASTALLGFCVEAAALLGVPAPANWTTKAARPYLPRACGEGAGGAAATFYSFLSFSLFLSFLTTPPSPDPLAHPRISP